MNNPRKVASKYKDHDENKTDEGTVFHGFLLSTGHLCNQLFWAELCKVRHAHLDSFARVFCEMKRTKTDRIRGKVLQV